MPHIAFLRNVNQGQWGHPSTADLTDAFAHGDGWAVIRDDRDRQSNGTPVIEAVPHEPATSRGLSTPLRIIDSFGV